MMIKKVVKQALQNLSFYFTRVGCSFNLYDPRYLSRVCCAKTVVDVGVGYGTGALYRAFPSAYLHLVEPIKEYKRSIDTLLQTYDGEVYFKAVGEEDGIVELDVDLDNLQLSSQFQRTSLTSREGNKIEKREVELTTLDGLLSGSRNLERPLVLKIDTEGNELNVLKGAANLLRTTDFVIAEASISKRFEGSYEFHELIQFMTEKDFYVYSILYIQHRTREKRPIFADIIFARNSNETGTLPLPH